MKSGWLESYYEALEFFYWEPQHLGRKKHSSAEFDTLPKVKRHLRNMEVTLNHNIHQFLALAPRALRNKFLGLCLGRDVSGDFVMEFRDGDKKFNLMNSTQPDLLFISSESTISVEMKIGAKSSIAQIQKYALLALAMEQIDGQKDSHALGLLGPGDFSSQFKEGIASLSELRKAIQDADHEKFLSKQPLRLRNEPSRFKQIVETLQIGFTNYQSFATMLEASMPDASDFSDGAEVFRNLIQGMKGELKIRRLAP